MARQLIYQGGVAGSAAGQGATRVGLSQAGGAPAADGAGMGLMRAARTAGEEILRIVAGEYKAGERARLDDILLRTDEAFERWKTEYRESRRGADATNAQADFAAKYEELARAAMEEYGGNADEIYRGELGRELRKRGLFALRDGGSYQNREFDAWNDSVLRGQVAFFEKVCAENPEDGARIELEMDDALRAWRERNPGLDDTEIRTKLSSVATRTRLDSLIAQGRLSEARSLLEGGANYRGENGSRIGGRAVTRGMGAETEGLIREAAARHGVDPELALAVAMQESSGNQGSVSHAGAIGVMQLMPDTARELGVDPRNLRENIDGGVRYLARQLKDFGGDVRDALTAYNMGPGGYRQYRAGKRGITKESREYAGRVLGRIRDHSITPIEAGHYRDRIEAAEKRAEADARDASFAGELASLSRFLDGDIDPETKASRVYEYLETIRDPDLRERLERTAREQLAFEDRAAKAREAREVRGLLTGLYSILDGSGDLASRAGAAYGYIGGVSDPERRLALERTAREQIGISERTERIRTEAALAARGKALEKLMDDEPDPTKRAAAVYEYLRSVPDAETRSALEREARERMAYDGRAIEAMDSEATRAIMAHLQARDFNPVQALRWLNQQTMISPGAREKVRRMLTGEDNKVTFQSIDALNQGLVAIDNGELQSFDERVVYAINNRLSPSMSQKLFDYQGNMEHVSIDQVRYAIQRYTDKKFKPEEVFAIYQQVAREIPKGQRATTASIAQAVNSILMKGTLPAPEAWFGNTRGATYGQAMLENRREEWLPDVVSAETPMLDEMLKERGKRPTPHNRKVMKKLWLGRPDSRGFEE